MPLLAARAPSGRSFLPPRASFWKLLQPSHRGLRCHAAFPSMCVSALFLQGHQYLDVGTTLVQDDLTPTHYSTATKSLFPDKVTFRGSGWTRTLWEDTIQKYLEMSQNL